MRAFRSSAPGRRRLMPRIGSKFRKLVDLSLFALSALCTAFAMISLRTQFADGGTAIDLGGFAAATTTYLAGIGFWLVAMMRRPLSAAYALGIGFTLGASVLLGVWLLDEAMTPQKAIGTVIIFVGVLLVFHQKATTD